MINALLFFVFLTFNVFGAKADVYYLFDDNNKFNELTVIDAEFKKYRIPVNQGLKNGVFWFKFYNSEASVVQVENTQISVGLAYQDGKAIEPLLSRHYLTFELEPGLALIRLVADKQAYIPIQVTPQFEFLQHQQDQSVITGIFYGFALMVLILNLFFYFSFKESTFVLYAIFLLSVMVAFAHRDGFLNMLGVSKNVLHYSEGFSHFFTGLTGTWFASAYLNMRRNVPVFLKSLYVFIAISFALDLAYLMTNAYIYNALSDLFILYIFVGCWLVSVRFAMQYHYALYFSIAYSLIVVLIVDFYILAAFGVYRIGIDAILLKLGGYFEMLIISAAVMYRMRVLKAENQAMRHQIEDHIQHIDHLAHELEKNSQGTQNHFSQYDLSARENEVLQLIAKGLNNQRIADELYISVNTIKFHVKNIYKKLNINSRKDVLKILG